MYGNIFILILQQLTDVSIYRNCMGKYFYGFFYHWHVFIHSHIVHLWISSLSPSISRVFEIPPKGLIFDTHPALPGTKKWAGKNRPLPI
jgi:hypothetical protein